MFGEKTLIQKNANIGLLKLVRSKCKWKKFKNLEIQVCQIGTN